MSGSDWIFTVRVRVKNLSDHSEPDAEDVARCVINEENGFAGLCDWPDDFEIVSVEPVNPNG